MLKEFMDMLLHWLPTTTIAYYMGGKWEWPAAESLHFIGLSMLVGTVGLFDLRLLGVGRSIALPSLHRLVPWGILGYCINVFTGICFFTAAPYLFMFNPSFQLKVLFMAIAGVNVLLFYTTMFRRIKLLGPGENAPLPARIIGGVSLFLWLGVITFGRLLTFYKPPFHWCPWC
jgi:hypothetical protein